MASATRTGEEDGRPDADDEQAGDQGQPRIERLGDDEAREQQRHEAEREDADGVRDGHDPTEQDGVDRPPLGADEIAGDDRLPVPGRQRVRSAPEGSDRQREQDDAERELATRDQRLEAAALMPRRRAGAQ